MKNACGEIQVAQELAAKLCTSMWRRLRTSVGLPPGTAPRHTSHDGALRYGYNREEKFGGKNGLRCVSVACIPSGCGEGRPEGEIRVCCRGKLLLCIHTFAPRIILGQKAIQGVRIYIYILEYIDHTTCLTQCRDCHPPAWRG